MDHPADNLAIALFSEVIAVDQLTRSMLARVLPQGMELSQFAVLNYLAAIGDERSPAQIAKAFHLTRGAMTNTLSKLAWAGWVHIRPDWDDARRKMVSLSPAGRAAREAAVAAIGPLMGEVVARVGEERVRTLLPVMRELRVRMSEE